MNPISRSDKAVFLCVPALLLQVTYTYAYWIWHMLLVTLPVVVFVPPPLVIDIEILLLYPYFLVADVYVPLWIFMVLYRKR